MVENEVHQLAPKYQGASLDEKHFRFFPEWALSYLRSRWRRYQSNGSEEISPALHELTTATAQELGFNPDAVPFIEFPLSGAERCGRFAVFFDVFAEVESASGVKTERDRLAKLTFIENKSKNCSKRPNDRPDDTRDLSPGLPRALASASPSNEQLAREMVGRGESRWVRGYSARARSRQIALDHQSYLDGLPPETDETMGSEEPPTPENDPVQWALIEAGDEAEDVGFEGELERRTTAGSLLPTKVLGSRLGGLASLLDKLSAPADFIEPLASLDPATDSLLVPSGGLLGLWQSPAIRGWLADFVGAGGSLFVFGQQHGSHYAALPGGDEIEAVGWDEAQSCFANAARIDADHPGLAGASGPIGATLNVGVDGHFRRLPQSAQSLLSATGSGYPVLATYPFGNGTVVVTTLFEDDAKGRGMASQQGLGIVKNLSEWLRSPVAMPSFSSGAGAIPVTQVVHVPQLGALAGDQGRLFVARSKGTGGPRRGTTARLGARSRIARDGQAWACPAFVDTEIRPG